MKFLYQKKKGFLKLFIYLLFILLILYFINSLLFRCLVEDERVLDLLSVWRNIEVEDISSGKRSFDSVTEDFKFVYKVSIYLKIFYIILFNVLLFLLLFFCLKR